MKNFWNKIVRLFTGNMPYYRVIADNDYYKMVIIIPSEAADELSNKQWKKLRPKWAIDNNFIMRKSKEATINSNGELINLWQINGVAVFWKKKEEV